MATLTRTIGSPLSMATATVWDTQVIERTSTYTPVGVANYLAGVPVGVASTSSSQTKTELSPLTTGLAVAPAGTYGPLDLGPAGDINNSFAIALGGAGVNQNGPFSNTRFNMGGFYEVISISDPRHTSHAYQDRFPDLFAGYQAGSLTGTQLFNTAMYRNTHFDTVERGDFTWRPSTPPIVRFTFNRSGGGTITGTGISW